MQSNYRYWLWAFGLLSFVNLIAEFVHQPMLIYITKPLLLTTLSIYFYLVTKNKATTFSQFILYGLIFSIFGDTFLMFNENNSNSELYFLLGLGSFLITHICYATAFVKYPSKEIGWVKKRPLIIIPFLLLLIGNTTFIWADIPSDLKIAVPIYSSVIVIMAISCANLASKLPKNIFQYLLLGVLLFVLSDSIISLNKFKSAQLSLPYPRLLIMIPYLVSQYFIATYSIKANKHLRHQLKPTQ